MIQLRTYGGVALLFRMPGGGRGRKMAFRICVSSLAADRLSAARDLLRARVPTIPTLIIGASRGAADDLAREVAADLPATFGLQRVSLTQLAARSAIVALATEGLTPSTWLGAEAVAARAAFDATRQQSLKYFAPVVSTPGFPRALARTLQELRLARVDARQLLRASRGGSDLADLLERVDESFDRASSVDRATLFQAATEVVKRAHPASIVALIDLPVDRRAEVAFIEALIAGSETAFATMPASDREGIARLEAMGGSVEVVERGPSRSAVGDLACLRRYLFNPEAPPVERALDGSLSFFSAPGEGREAVEIARRILREARAGVRFDEMAVLVRSPQNYIGLIEHALRRAKVPAWFSRGTRRPLTAGRAFLALLACAAEQLSASRFAEYLSFAQVPLESEKADASWATSADESFGRLQAPADESDAPSPESRTPDPGSRLPDPGSEPVIAGTLRAPWRWEALIVDAAVIGRDATRWARRLEGKHAEIERQIREAKRDDGGDEAKVAGLRLVQRQLEYLEAFALPIIEEMAGWPVSAAWGEWLDRFAALAPRVLKSPAHVLRVLADLRPMGEVGPVDLDEARRVLAERLLTMESEPPAYRYGRVFVGTPEQARGRTFRVVFVPGLAERMFPQKPREDPIMLDGMREVVDPALPVQRQRLASERLLLQLAAGAASDRLHVSYPRIELSESRARVPSFYALDVMRAATGRVPHHDELEQGAREAGDATLAWPAPSSPEDAIDDQERDLAVLRRLLDEVDPEAVKGHAHYLLKLNECLRRSVVDRWARGQRRWSPSDGLTRVQPYTREALAAQRLNRRSYSASALQLFSACPYQFVLSAMYRLRPFEQPEPLQHMDPLTRGSLFHEIQASFFRTLQSRGELPVTLATIDSARPVLDEVTEQVGVRAHDELVPAVERVWQGELAAIRRDLHGWLEYLARDGAEWLPIYFELGFGAVPGERDEHSIRGDVVIDGRFRLRGAIDLIEEHAQTRALRITDHKTGRKPDRIDRVLIGGGAVLQPVLYSLAVEAALAREVSHGRLFYCTSTGSFFSHPILLDERSRAAGLEALEVVDRAIETGFLAAAPTEEACGRCDFTPVCGSDVFRRVARKPPEALADLRALRERP
jgi:ATP-dependent helicase/nuclease subunit B